MLRGGFVILAGGKSWFSSGNTKELVSDNPTKSKPKKVGKPRASAKGTPKIINPIFDSISKMCKDPFWKEMFKSMSFGKFPRSFRYENRIITHRIRSKTYESHLNYNNLEETMLNVITFIQKHSGILSTQDKEERAEKIKENIEMMSKIRIDSWSMIKTKTHKQTVIYKFVNVMKKRHKLTNDKKNELLSVILRGMLARILNQSNIHVYNGHIISISPLRMSTEGNFFLDLKKHDNLNVKSPIVINTKSDIRESLGPPFDSEWVKFIKSIKSNHERCDLHVKS